MFGRSRPSLTESDVLAALKGVKDPDLGRDLVDLGMIKDVRVGGDEVIVMAGPCSAETEEQVMASAAAVKRAGAKILRGGAFKPRSSPYSFQGLGEQGLQMLRRAADAHNLKLIAKYREMAAAEARADLFMADDADVLIVAANTPARMAKGAVRALRGRKVRAGLFRPITLWPFPVRQLAPLLRPGVPLLVVEASDGQLEDELRLAMSHAGLRTPITSLRHYGGVLPRTSEIVETALQVESARGAVA